MSFTRQLLEENGIYIEGNFLNEDIKNAKEAEAVIDIVEGKQLYKKIIDAFKRVIFKKKYSKINVLKTDIERCDKALSDIDDELQKTYAMGQDFKTAFLKRSLIRIIPMVIGGAAGLDYLVTNATIAVALAPIVGASTVLISQALFDKSKSILIERNDKDAYSDFLKYYKSEITRIKAELESKLKALEQEELSKKSKSVKESVDYDLELW